MKRAFSGSNGLLDAFSEDAAFNFGLAPSRPGKQSIHGNHVRAIESNPKVLESHTHNPSQLDFEITSQKAILCGPFTRFVVSGYFMRKKADVPANPAVDPPIAAVVHGWEKIPHNEVAAEAAKVILAPGWFDYLVKNVDVYHNNTRVTTSSENKYIAQHLNRFLDAYQNKDVVRLFAPQDCHPNRLVMPFLKSSYKYGYEGWTKYATHALSEDNAVEFDWYPRDTWPFQQSPNFIADKDPPQAILMPNLGGKLLVRVSFVDDWSTIFKKTGTESYKFKMTGFKLLVNEANLPLSLEKSLFTQKRTLFYPGVTKKMEIATVSAQQATYSMVFNEVFMPEGILVFCLDKNVPNGTYSFAADTHDTMFREHNVDAVEVSFDSERFAIKSPQPGELSLDSFDNLRYLQHLLNPIFGVMPDTKELHINHFKQGGAYSNYPHIYMPLTSLGGGNESRIVPVHNDGSCLNKRSKLEVFLKYKKNGAPADVVTVFIIFYTNKNLAFDCKNKVFFSPHNIAQY